MESNTEITRHHFPDMAACALALSNKEALGVAAGWQVNGYEPVIGVLGCTGPQASSLLWAEAGRKAQVGDHVAPFFVGDTIRGLALWRQKTPRVTSDNEVK